MQAHPSIYHYRHRKCRCPGCVACNTEHKKTYRVRRLENCGQPLKPTGKMPSTLYRLRREIGIFAPWQS